MAADTLVLVVVVAREVIVMVVRVSGMIVIVEIVVVVVVSIVKTVVRMLVMTAMIVVAVMVIVLIKMNWMVEFVVADKIAVFVGYISADYKLVEEAGCDIFVEVVGKFVAGLLIEFDTVMDCMVDYMIEAGFELPIVKEEEEVEKPECETGIVAAALTKTAVEKVLEEGRTFFFFLFSSFSLFTFSYSKKCVLRF